MQIITQFLALSVREGLLLPVGEIMDLVDLEKQRRNLVRKEDD